MVLATATSESLWVWMPMMPSKRWRTCDTISARRAGQGAAVGVAEAEDIGAGAFGGFERAQGEVGIMDVAVEEMLGVVDDFLAVVDQVLHGFEDELLVLFLGDTEGALGVEVPTLAEDGDHRGSGLDERADVAVFCTGFLAKRVEPKAVSRA